MSDVPKKALVLLVRNNVAGAEICGPKRNLYVELEVDPADTTTLAKNKNWLSPAVIDDTVV